VEGHETLRETRCAKLTARVDMARASALHDGGLRAPAVERFEELLALPVTVWTDDRFIRRVHFDHEQKKQLTLELWDFDVPTDELDWSRLPTFKSPEEAAYDAAERISRRERVARTFRARTGKRYQRSADAGRRGRIDRNASCADVPLVYGERVAADVERGRPVPFDSLPGDGVRLGGCEERDP
jgi:hypothetical protein